MRAFRDCFRSRSFFSSLRSSETGAGQSSSRCGGSSSVGGSSRQKLLVVEGRSVRSRLLSAREAARLMGLPDSYRLPARYNEAYHLAGDGVVAPVVRHLAEHLLEPLARAARDGRRGAAA